jgi:hypothetical protein
MGRPNAGLENDLGGGVPGVAAPRVALSRPADQAERGVSGEQTDQPDENDEAKNLLIGDAAFSFAWGLSDAALSRPASEKWWLSCRSAGAWSISSLTKQFSLWR